jgi:hypothetical protein
MSSNYWYTIRVCLTAEFEVSRDPEKTRNVLLLTMTHLSQPASIAAINRSQRGLLLGAGDLSTI